MNTFEMSQTDVCVCEQLLICALYSNAAYLYSHRAGVGGAQSAPGSSRCSTGVRTSHRAPPLLLTVIEVVPYSLART